MPIHPPVTTDEPVKASTTNAILNALNQMNRRVVITASTTWQVPSGVNCFRVDICGGGGRGGDVGFDGDGNVSSGGGWGGDSPLASKVFVDQEEGTSFAVTIGVGGALVMGVGERAPTASQFGAGLIVSNPGSNGSTASNSIGTPGSQTGADIVLGPQTYMQTGIRGYGQGGYPGNYHQGGNWIGGPGGNGVCVISW